MTTTRQITIERTFRATIEDVWELWTTAEGIESWWGPEGFRVAVRSLDLRPGGELHYAMIAVAAEMVAFMEQHGMPTTTETSIAYVEIVAPRKLAYSNRVDFVPGHEPYDVGTLVELHEVPGGVRTVVRIDAMHEEVWTQRAVMGWESELGKLEKLLQARAK